MPRGYDFRFGYSSGVSAPVDNYQDEEDIINKQCELYQQRLKNDWKEERNGSLGVAGSFQA